MHFLLQNNLKNSYLIGTQIKKNTNEILKFF